MKWTARCWLSANSRCGETVARDDVPVSSMRRHRSWQSGCMSTSATSVKAVGVRVAKGRFRAHMDVTLTNDGPVTLNVESK